MKDLYLVLDYSAREQNSEHVRTSNLKEYVRLKNEAADRAKWLSAIRAPADIGFVADMRDPKASLDAAIQFIQPKLWSRLTNNVKILVGGHGQVNESDGIVMGGSGGTQVGVRNRKIAEHILLVTRHFSTYPIHWHISLCVCYAGRPTKSATSSISSRSAFRSSMSGELAKLLQSHGLRNFQLKANFTSVSVGDDGHLLAESERSQQEKFARASLELTARARYPRGFQFWKKDSYERGMLLQFFSHAYARGHYTRDNALDSAAQRQFKQAFLDTVADEPDQEFSRLVEICQRQGALDQILNYRLVAIVEHAFEPESIREANKVIWTCDDGKLSHSLVLRE